ncbi:hypothetical protein GMRT_14080 [Giardia muris]|uniref:Uncharacterized protein n=1 Tax=Giardia muris TaxID=5742 RepID=A0A4Z1STP1_GIAMU|nr:hypothetical protein GMRT_14080 [Giardia muris]|eukprot:TNJ29286.1 hypothetical protein GMRT_14080 [Giardia muris]
MTNDRNLDWNKTTGPLPYMWADLELPVYELSEIFLPVDISTAHFATSRTSFLSVFETELKPDEAHKQYDAVVEGATCTLVPGNTKGGRRSIGDLAKDVATFARYADSPPLSSRAVFERIRGDLQRGSDNPKQAMQALLYYLLGVRLDFTLPLPLNPDVILSRAFLLALFEEGSLLKLIVSGFSATCKECTIALHDLKAETTQNASKQLSQILILYMQVLHLVLTSLNLRGISIFEPKDATPIYSYSKYTILIIRPLADLLIGLVQADSTQTNSTFNNTIARCVASYRPIALMRQALIAFLGCLGDHKQARKCRVLKASMRSTDDSPISVCKSVKRLPPPRFRGYVNPTSSLILSLVKYFEGSYKPRSMPMANGSQNPYAAAEVVRQAQQAAEALTAFSSRQTTRRKMMPVGGVSEDCANKRDDTLMALFQLLPKPEVRTGLLSITELHGGHLAMKFSCDARDAIMPNTQGASIGGQKDYEGTEGNLTNTFGNFVVTQDYRLYQSRVERGLTTIFPFSGRPIKNGNLQYFEGCLDKVLHFNYSSDRFSSLKKKEILKVFQSALPLDVQRSMLARISNEEEYDPDNQLSCLLRHVDMTRFIAALLRLMLCSVPHTLEAVLTSKVASNAVGDAVKGLFSNNAAPSIRHIRESVLKSTLHTLLILQSKSRQMHPTFGLFIAKIIQLCNGRGCGLDAVIATMSLPAAAYIMGADTRTPTTGTCLFAVGAVQGQGAGGHGSRLVLTPEEVAADATEFMQTRFAKGNFPTDSVIDPTKPLHALACSRRIFCLLTASRCFYGYVAHSPARAQEAIALYSKVSSNYISCILQSSNPSVSQQQTQAAPSSTGPENLSQTTVFSKGIGRKVGGGANQPGTGQRGAPMTYIPGNLANIMEFLRGDNSVNNPANINTSATLTCSFPGYQLSKANNISSIIILLKIAKQVLPFAGGEARVYGIFEQQGLPAFREYVTKLIYQLAVSPCSEDSWRWTRDVVSTNWQTFAALERRVMNQFLERYVFQEQGALPDMYRWAYEAPEGIPLDTIVEEILALSQINAGWPYHRIV